MMGQSERVIIGGVKENGREQTTESSTIIRRNYNKFGKTKA